MTEPQVKPCPVCGHAMEQITRIREGILEPSCQWECLCGHHEPTYTAQEEGQP